MPVDHRLPAPAMASLHEALRPTLVTAAGSGEATALPGRLVEEGDALVVATSGTTGTPKGVVLTHESVTASARATSTAIGADAGRDTWLCCLPLAHAGGLGVVTRALATGTPLRVLAGFNAGIVAEEASALTRGGRRVLVSLVATSLRRVDPGLFKVVLLGGDAPPVWEAPAWPGGRPAPVVVTYGMTETGGGCVYDGAPLAGVEAQVDGSGQIRLRGPVLGRAYRRADGDTALAGAQGWYDTGDGGRWDPRSGRLVVDGRLDDVIVTGGEMVWPAQVEAVLGDCPGVARVAVVGRPDPEWGQRVVAVVVASDPTSPPSLDSLRAVVRDRLAPWAAPKEVEVVESLPTTALGKLRRAALR